MLNNLWEPLCGLFRGALIVIGKRNVKKENFIHLPWEYLQVSYGRIYNERSCEKRKS